MPSQQASSLRLSGLTKICAEKGIDIGMEILVEGNAIKARSIRADSREFQFFVRRTRSQEIDVNSICCKMKIRFRRQSVFDPKTTTPGLEFMSNPTLRPP